MAKRLKTVGVFCGTDQAIPSFYKKEAYALGKALAERGYGLVTGGGNTGLMEAVVNGFASVAESRGVPKGIQGIVPAIFKRYKAHHEKIPEESFVWTETLHQRLQIFSEKCDLLVVLAGGFGTLHELMDFLVPKQWGLHDKKVILVNSRKFWDPLLLQFRKMVRLGALKKGHFALLTVVKGVKGCLKALEARKTAPRHRGLKERYWEKA